MTLKSVVSKRVLFAGAILGFLQVSCKTTHESHGSLREETVAEPNGAKQSADSDLAALKTRVEEDELLKKAVMAANSKQTFNGIEAYDEECLTKNGSEYLEKNLRLAQEQLPKLTKLQFDSDHYQSKTLAVFLFDKFSHDDFTHVYGGHYAALANPSSPYIFFPCMLVNKEMAPIVHEFTHLMLWKSWSGALREGVAEYFQFEIAPQEDSFGANVSDPHADAKQAYSEGLLTEIAKNMSSVGYPDYGDSKGAKVAYYAYARSFVHYILKIREVPMETFLQVYSSDEGEAAFQKFTKHDLNEWRRDWIEFLQKKDSQKEKLE